MSPKRSYAAVLLAIAAAIGAGVVIGQHWPGDVGVRCTSPGDDFEIDGEPYCLAIAPRRVARRLTPE